MIFDPTVSSATSTGLTLVLRALYFHRIIIMLQRKGSKEAKDILLEYFVLEFFESSFIGRDREDQIVLLFFELRLLFSDHDSQELVFQSCAQDNKVLDFVSSGYLFLYRPLDLVRLPFILLSVSISFALYYLPFSN